MKHKILFFIFLFCGVQVVCSQVLRQPFEFPILLSGNFGELRANHFHAGIDFKTGGVEGKAVHAVADGYVSRVSVSPWGYGNGLYLTHDDGTTTVYGHLSRYAVPLADSIRALQYAAESFTLDHTFTPDQFPVKQGDVVAYSGNTGSSGGPHLHFEVREAETGDLLDPIPYFQEQITDRISPIFRGLLFIPVEGKGVVNGKCRKLEQKLVKTKNGTLTLSGHIEAWGEIGVALDAYDQMDGTSNVYGVKEISLEVDDEEIYHSFLDQYNPDDTRYLNSFVDYETWRRNKTFYIRSYQEPGNRLPFIRSINRGIVRIDEEKTYRFTYIIKDAFGNTSRFSFSVEGKEQEIPSVEEGELFTWMTDNRFGAKAIRLTIPKGNLYSNLYFRYAVKEDSTRIAPIHRLHHFPLALHGSAMLSLRIVVDTLTDKQAYGIVRLTDEGRQVWVGGTYRQGWMDAKIRELGRYTVACDTVPPRIVPQDEATWQKRRRFIFRLRDNLSGIQSYRGEIDGRFVLFEMDSHQVVSCVLDRLPWHLDSGEHTLTLMVTDSVGNETSYTTVFRQ